MENWTAYLAVAAVSATLFLLGAAWALHWAHKNGQLSNLDKGAESIFDEEEPMGRVTDGFPQRQGKKPGPPQSGA